MGSRGISVNSAEYILCVASRLQLESDSDAHVLIPAKSASPASELLVGLVKFGGILSKWKWRSLACSHPCTHRCRYLVATVFFGGWVGGWVGTRDGVRVFVFSRTWPNRVLFGLNWMSNYLSIDDATLNMIVHFVLVCSVVPAVLLP